MAYSLSGVDTHILSWKNSEKYLGCKEINCGQYQRRSVNYMPRYANSAKSQYFYETLIAEDFLTAQIFFTIFPR
jgi:hypothetical protein